MQGKKHKVIGIMLIGILLVVALLLLLSYRKALEHPYWQLYRAPPVALLNEAQQQEQQASTIKKIDELLSKNFHDKLQGDNLLPAWLIRGPNFGTKKAAELVLRQLQALGLDSFMQPTKARGTFRYAVYVGPFTEESEAKKALNLMQESLKMIGILQHYSMNAMD